MRVTVGEAAACVVGWAGCLAVVTGAYYWPLWAVACAVVGGDNNLARAVAVVLAVGGALCTVFGLPFRFGTGSGGGH